MTSIVTNSSAMVALQTLRSINTNLDETNNRVSTGLRVNNAADNAAYWSIATTMKSDNMALSAVTDSLAIGASSLNVTYTGLDSAKDVLDAIKAKLTTATGDGVDKGKIQSEIFALQEQLVTIANSASFSGQNWLSTGSSTAFSKEIVSALSRDTAGKLTVGSISVDITDIRLYGDGTTQFGMLDKTIDLTKYTATTTAAATVETAAIDFAAADDMISFSVSQNGAPARTVEITQATLAAAGLSDTSIRSNADLKTVIEQALKVADIQGVEIDVDASDNLVFSSIDNFTIGGATATGTSGLTVASLGFDAVAPATSSATAGATSVAAIDITAATSTDIQNYIRVVDEALSQVTTAASGIGAVQTRVGIQTEFIAKLMDTIEKGIGSLIDADMEEESTRLKALQTQQQLAIQSLSIANSASQNILSLFRN